MKKTNATLVACNERLASPCKKNTADTGLGSLSSPLNLDPIVISNQRQNMIDISHLAIIMDGNGRWAKKKGLSRSEGHKAGTNTAKKIVEECVALGIKYLTLYTFSTENWKRPKEEVGFLFELLIDFLQKETPSLVKQGVSVHVLGETAALPFATRKALDYAIKKTAEGTNLTLNLALNYSGREEVARACRLCVQEGCLPEDITAERLASYLYTKGQPDPDLVIRTSGEQRTSNFLLFQTAYSEYYFTETLWPDFSTEELHKALSDFRKRTRRFGAL